MTFFFNFTLVPLLLAEWLATRRAVTTSEPLQRLRTKAQPIDVKSAHTILVSTRFFVSSEDNQNLYSSLKTNICKRMLDRPNIQFKCEASWASSLVYYARNDLFCFLTSTSPVCFFLQDHAWRCGNRVFHSGRAGCLWSGTGKVSGGIFSSSGTPTGNVPL